MQIILVNSVTYGLKEIFIDDEFEYLKEFTWCAQKVGKKFYAIRKHKRVISVLMHRVITGATDRKIYVDHIDGNGLNNQINNLRICSHSENLCNMVSTNGTSKFKGVSWVKSRNKWKAALQKDKIPRYSRLFNNELDAALAYDAAAKIHHGEFANLNFK